MLRWQKFVLDDFTNVRLCVYRLVSIQALKSGGLSGWFVLGHRLTGPRPIGGIHPVALVEAQHLPEALLEVVRQEAVQEGVGAGVDVGEDHDEEVEDGTDAGLRDDVDQVDHVGGEEGQPAHHKHHHDDHHHACHLALRLAPLGQARPHAGRPHLNYNEQVAETYDQQGGNEAQYGRVEDEDRGPQVVGIGPAHVAGVEALLHVRVYSDGQHHKEGQHPHHEVEHLGHLRSSPFGTANGVHHGQVAVDAHRRQAEDRRELAHGVSRHVHSAEELPVQPVGQHALGAQEGDAQDVEFVSQGQVEDVHVSDGLHIGVAHHNVDDQRVAQQAHDEDDEVDDGGGPRPAAEEGRGLVEGSVGGGGVGVVHGRRVGLGGRRDGRRVLAT